MLYWIVFMENYKSVREIIYTETTQDITDVRLSFLEKYKDQIDRFVDNMSQAFLNWRSLDSISSINEKKAHVSALVYSSINLHVVSMKLFLSGYSVASGNLERQTIEIIALAILCSYKNLKILDRYIQNSYSANKALRDLSKYSKNCGLNKQSTSQLIKARDHFHAHSHPSYITVGSNFSFGDQHLYLGASFDSGKIEFYNKDVASRLSLSSVFNNYIDGIKKNLLEW
jgi:ABC-type transport system involved in cytochrome bd biosynthesis fused ATPase/permease subunit